jgi:prevent-host-death family protein
MEVRMRQVNIHEAKTHLSELIAAAERGEDIVISRANRPVVRLVSVSPVFKRPKLGGFEGQVWVAPDFDAPLDDFREYM